MNGPYSHSAFTEAGFVQRTLERDGCELRWWLCERDESAPLLICVHGGGMDHRMFAPQLPTLVPRFRTAVLDLRGHGASQCAASAFSLERAADDLIAIVDAAGAEDTVLVGHSFGGTICQIVAVRTPGRVRAFVGIGAACATMWAPLGMTMRSALNPVALRLLGQQRVRKMFAENAGVTPEVQAYAAEALSALSEDVFAEVMRTGFGRPREVPGYRMGVPLLLLQGRREAYKTFLSASSAWAARDKGRLVLVPDAGHNANQDAPEFVNRELEPFLASVLRDAAR